MKNLNEYLNSINEMKEVDDYFKYISSPKDFYDAILEVLNYKYTPEAIYNDWDSSISIDELISDENLKYFTDKLKEYWEDQIEPNLENEEE